MSHNFFKKTIKDYIRRYGHKITFIVKTLSAFVTYCQPPRQYDQTASYILKKCISNLFLANRHYAIMINKPYNS